jgi:hypothetical protein
MAVCRRALITLILIDGLTLTERRRRGRHTVIVNAIPLTAPRVTLRGVMDLQAEAFDLACRCTGGRQIR